MLRSCLSMPERRLPPSDLMLCTPKLDGVRELAAVAEAGEVEPTGRNGDAQNMPFREIVVALGRAAPTTTSAARGPAR